MVTDHIRSPGILWVASAGGHSRQAKRWSRILSGGESGFFAVGDSAQNRDLFRNSDAQFLHPVRSRELRSPLRFFRQLLREAPWRQVHTVISTGASVAVPVLIFFSLFTRKRAVYIESLTRVKKPSLSGRLLSLVPGVRLYSPHKGLGKRWAYINPQLDFLLERRAQRRPDALGLQIFVMTGTTSNLFPGMEQALNAVLRPLDELVIQGPLNLATGQVNFQAGHFSQTQMSEAFDWADVVISHAGVGSVLDSLEHGKIPVIVARNTANSGHPDNHQVEFSEWLLGEGLAQKLDPAGADRSILFDVATTVAKPSGPVAASGKSQAKGLNFDV